MGNPDLGSTGTNFMTILLIYYCKFGRFSNLVHEISARVLLNFLKYEVQVVVTDRYDFEFSIKAAEIKRWTKDSTHIQEIEIIDNRTSNVISKLPWEFNQ